jgi:thymidylate synthase ThyX
MSNLFSESKVELFKLSQEDSHLQAARVSYDNEGKSYSDESNKKLTKFLVTNGHKSPFFHQHSLINVDYNNYQKLINKVLLKMPHIFSGITIVKMHDNYFIKISDYSLSQISNLIKFHKASVNLQDLYRISKNPKIFRLFSVSFKISTSSTVFMQLDRSRVGFAINVRSRRYKTTDIQFYHPKKWRRQSKNNKQGSMPDDFVNENTSGGFSYEDICKILHDWYNNNIQDEMCAEQARLALPHSSIIKFIWTGDLLAWARLLNLRIKPDVQIETKDVAKKIYKILKDNNYPIDEAMKYDQRIQTLETKRLSKMFLDK